MKNRNIHCRSFRTGRCHEVPVLLIPRGDTAAVITRPQELWQHHYSQALEQGNNHTAAKRYADLMAR